MCLISGDRMLNPRWKLTPVTGNLQDSLPEKNIDERTEHTM